MNRQCIFFRVMHVNPDHSDRLGITSMWGDTYDDHNREERKSGEKRVEDEIYLFVWKREKWDGGFYIFLKKKQNSSVEGLRPLQVDHRLGGCKDHFLEADPPECDAE